MGTIISNWQGIAFIIGGIIGLAIQIHTYYLLRTGKSRKFSSIPKRRRNEEFPDEHESQLKYLTNANEDYSKIVETTNKYLRQVSRLLVERASQSGVTEQEWKLLALELQQTENELEQIERNSSLYFEFEFLSKTMLGTTPQLNHATEELIEEQAEQAQQQHLKIQTLSMELADARAQSQTLRKHMGELSKTIELLLIPASKTTLSQQELLDTATRIDVVTGNRTNNYVQFFWIIDEATKTLREVAKKQQASNELQKLIDAIPSAISAISNATNLSKIATETTDEQPTA